MLRTRVYKKNKVEHGALLASPVLGTRYHSMYCNTSDIGIAQIAQVYNDFRDRGPVVPDYNSWSWKIGQM